MCSSFLGTTTYIDRNAKREIREPAFPAIYIGELFIIVCSAFIIISGSARPTRVRSELSNNYSLFLIYVYTFRNCLNHARPRNTRNTTALNSNTWAISDPFAFMRVNVHVVHVLIKKRDETRSNPRGEFYDEMDFTHLVDFVLLYSFLRRWTWAAPHTRACPFKGASTHALGPRPGRPKKSTG